MKRAVPAFLIGLWENISQTVVLSGTERCYDSLSLFAKSWQRVMAFSIYHRSVRGSPGRFDGA